MAKGYWVVRADITDQNKFAEYAKRTPAALEKYQGKFLARAGKFAAVEGSTRSRNTIIEFPSYEHALDCWNSDEYQQARSFRLDGADLDIVIVEGV